MSADPSPLSEDAVPRLGRGVRLKHDTVRDNWVLLAPERMFALDPVAVEIVKRIDGETSLAGIVDDLTSTFAAERSRILADVRNFLAALIEKRAVVT